MGKKILFIGVGSAGCKIVDKAMKDNPDLFNSIAIDCHPIGGEETLWPYIDLLEGRDEPAGFMMYKRNVEEVLAGRMDEIRECIKNAFVEQNEKDNH